MLMRLFKLLLAMVFLGVSVCGCIKEQRGRCPCCLWVDMAQVDTSVAPVARITVVGESGFVFDEQLDADRFEKGVLVMVPKGDCRVLVYSGEEGLAEPHKGLVIPYGSECPEVYMYAAEVDTDCEQSHKTVSLSKNYCRLSICVEDAAHFPFTLSVKGEVAGYGADGMPVKGQFFHNVETVGDDLWVMAVPRQRDNSMLLEVRDETEVLKTFALGEYISASGYDWHAADLQDITIGIDYTRTKLSIAVKGWDDVYEFDVVI